MTKCRDLNKIGKIEQLIPLLGGASMDNASSSPQSDNRSSSPSKGESVEIKGDNTCIPTKGTSKRGVDSGFNDIQICNCLNKTAATMSSMLMAANSVRAAACERECGYVSSEKEKKKACDALIDSKKSFAERIRAELKAVDEDYHRMFRQQAKDVDMLVMSMGTQVLNLHDTHIEELCTIEIDFQTQRKELLQRLIRRYMRSS